MQDKIEKNENLNRNNEDEKLLNKNNSQPISRTISYTLNSPLIIKGEFIFTVKEYFSAKKIFKVFQNRHNNLKNEKYNKIKEFDYN